MVLYAIYINISKYWKKESCESPWNVYEMYVKLIEHVEILFGPGITISDITVPLAVPHSDVSHPQINIWLSQLGSTGCAWWKNCGQFLGTW